MNVPVRRRPVRALRKGVAAFTGRRRRLSAAAGIILLVAGSALSVCVGLRAHFASPPPTLLLRDRHGQFLGEIGSSDAAGSGYWPLAAVPARVAAASIAVEDHRFWHHPGVDIAAIARAAWQDLRHGRIVSGASTLAMQVARMQRPGRRTLLRKAVEALTAIALTARYGREAVLKQYLRIVPYGNQVHGIAYAARRYLDKPVADLSWAEVAFLAAIPQSPARMNPLDPLGRRRAIKRGVRILQLLRAEGKLSQPDYRLARSQIRDIRIPVWGTRPEEALHAVLHLEQVLRRRKLRQQHAQRPIVTTTIDLQLQRQISWMTIDALSRWERLGAGNAAVVVVDRHTWGVLAWVGSSDYFDTRHAGAIDYAEVPRSPGSTLKPFIYATALDHGVITAATVLDDLHRGAGGIGNADFTFMGPMLPRVALANSRNVPAANLLAAIGLDAGYDMLGRLGLHDWSVPAAHWGLGLAIGNMPVTLEHLMTAYTTLAGDGRLRRLSWLRDDPAPCGKRIFSEDTVRQITLFLSDPMARLPTFQRMGSLEYPFPVAAKTGTSSGYHDAWTVAWSRRYLVGAWVGDPGFRPMNHVTGSSSAAVLVHRVMLLLNRSDADGLEDVGFPPPRGWVPVRLCALTGKLATAACDRVVQEYFPPGRAPHERCRVHRRLAIDTRNGLLASSRTPPEDTEVRTFTDLGPKYAEWQMSAHLPRPPTEVSPLGAGKMALRVARAPVGTHRWTAAARAQRVEIVRPERGLRVIRDPETPPRFATLNLEAVVDPPSEQLLWIVDGKPFKLVDYPYAVSWPLAPGAHTIQAEIPFTSIRAAAVRIEVY